MRPFSRAHNFVTRIFRFAASFVLGVTLTVVTAPSQTEQARELFVTANSDYLLASPSEFSRPSSSVVLGEKLTVVKSRVPGWYLAYMTADPSKFGYIRIKSVGSREELQRIREQSIENEKSTTIRPPKEIVLDSAPEKASSGIETASRTIPIVISNQCIASLFCPDVEDIFTLLFDNEEKFAKGKFEKTVDWEKRKSSVLNQVRLGGGKTLGDRMTFLYEVGTGSLYPKEMQYNADNEKWTIPLDFRISGDQKCVPIFSPKSGQILCFSEANRTSHAKF